MTLKLAIRYLKGRKLRTALTTLSIVFGVMIVFGMNGLIPALSAAFDESMNESVHQVDILLTHELGLVFDDQTLDILREQEDILVVSPVLEQTLSLGDNYSMTTVEGDKIEKIIVNGWDPNTSKQALPLNLEGGRWITGDDEQVLLARRSFLEKVGLEIGDSILLPTAYGPTQFEIIGMLPKAPALGKEEVYMPLDEAQKLFNLQGKISAAIAQFDPTVENEDQRRHELKAHFEEGFAFGAIDAGGNEWTAIIEMGNVIFTVFGVVALAMGGFIMYNTFKVSIHERTKDIGMLRTLGARKADIMKIVLFEGALQGIVGTIIGMVCGYLLLLFTIPAIQPIWKELFNVELGQAQFPFYLYILSSVLGVGIPVASVIVPARRAVAIEPLDAIRPTVKGLNITVYGKPLWIGLGLIVMSIVLLVSGNAYMTAFSSILFLVGMIIISPFVVRPLLNILQLSNVNQSLLMARENTLRESKRSANTAVTMLVSVTFIIAVTGMAATFTNGLMGYMQKSMSSDYLILQDAMILGSEGSVGAGADLSQKILSIPGVDEITELRQSDAKAGDVPLSMIGIDVDSYQNLSGLTFLSDNEQEAYKALKTGKNVIINGALSVQGGYDVGDVIVLTTVNGKVAYKVVGIGLDYLNSKSATAYMSHENIETDYNVYNNALIMVNREGAVNSKKVESDLVEVMMSYPTFSVLSYEVWLEFQEDGNSTRNMFMYFMTAFLAVPALIALMNTLSMNIIERTREIGMLRAIGMTVKHVRDMIVYESLIISMMGVVLGTLVGIWMGYGFVQLMNVSGFVLQYYFPTTGILVSAFVGISFGLIASIAPIRRASRLDIVDAIKYE